MTFEHGSEVCEPTLQEDANRSRRPHRGTAVLKRLIQAGEAGTFLPLTRDGQHITCGLELLKNRNLHASSPAASVVGRSNRTP